MPAGLPRSTAADGSACCASWATPSPLSRTRPPVPELPALYVPLDVNWADHPAVMAADLEGAGAHAIALTLAKRLNRDGRVPRALLERYRIGPELIGRLVQLELLVDHGA